MTSAEWVERLIALKDVESDAARAEAEASSELRKFGRELLGKSVYIATTDADADGYAYRFTIGAAGIVEMGACRGVETSVPEGNMLRVLWVACELKRHALSSARRELCEFLEGFTGAKWTFWV